MPSNNASFIKRFAGVFLSLIIYLVIVSIILGLGYLYKAIEFAPGNPCFWLLVLEVMLSFIIFESIIQGIYGFTLAKLFLGLRVVDYNSGKSIGVIRSLIRTVLAFISSLTLGLGYIAIVFNRDKKSLHDLLTSSLVVELEAKAMEKFFRSFITLVSCLVGVSITISVLAAFIVVPYLSFKRAEIVSKFPRIESKILEEDPTTSLVINISADKIPIMLQFNNVEYIDFKIDPQSEKSYISKNKLKSIGAGFLDYAHLGEEHIIAIPQITIKDLDSKDLRVYDFSFIVSENTNILGRDFLDLFNSQINEVDQTLEIKLYEENQTILKDTSLDKDSKAYLLNMLSSIRASWQEYLLRLDPKQIEAFSKLKLPLSNDIEIKFDTKSGFITQITLTEASEEAAFNEICVKFLEALPKFRKIPLSLEAQKIIKLSLKLEYEEII